MNSANRKCFLVLALFAGLGMAVGNSYAGWDEGVDGDLSNVELSPTLVSLSGGSNLIIGTIGGGGNGDPPPADFNDALTFTIGPGQMLAAAMLDSYVTAGGNATSGFNFFTGSSWDGVFGGPNQIETIAMDVGDIGTNLLSSATPLGPGDYTLALREGTPGQSYQFDFQVTPIPEPAAGGLLVLAAAAVFIVRRN